MLRFADWWDRLSGYYRSQELGEEAQSKPEPGHDLPKV
jgi:hypothetical protein